MEKHDSILGQSKGTASQQVTWTQPEHISKNTSPVAKETESQQSPLIIVNCQFQEGSWLSKISLHSHSPMKATIAHNERTLEHDASGTIYFLSCYYLVEDRLTMLSQ